MLLSANMRRCCLFSQIYKEKLLVCLCGYFLSLNWPVWWLLLKVTCVLSAFSIPISSAYSYFQCRLRHHPPCPCSISSAHSGMVLAYRNRRSPLSLSFPPGQQLQPSSLLILSNQPGWREGHRELRVEGESRGATPCACNQILFICWSFSISIPPPSLSDWYWVTDGSEESIACFWECCNCFSPGKQTLG